MWDPVQEHLMVGCHLLQFFADELWAAQRSTEHTNTLPLWRKSVVSTPHDGVWIRHPGICGESMPTRRLHPTSVPNLCLPQVNLDAGVSPQLTLKDAKYRHDPVRVARNVQIVQERHQPVVNASLKRCAVREAEQNWHENVALFASFTLVACSLVFQRS